MNTGVDKKLVAAAKSLSDRYRTEPWFVAVGIGNGDLYLYVIRRPKVVMPETWEGFPLNVSRTGRFRPCQA